MLVGKSQPLRVTILQNEKKMVSSPVKIFLHHFGKDKGYSECP
jgi:hypothetical protein